MARKFLRRVPIDELPLVIILWALTGIIIVINVVLLSIIVAGA